MFHYLLLRTLIALNRSDVAWPKFNLVLWNAGRPFRIIVISAHLFELKLLHNSERKKILKVTKIRHWTTLKHITTKQSEHFIQGLFHELLHCKTNKLLHFRIYIMLVFSQGIPEQTWLKRDFKKPKKNFVKNPTISDFKDTMHTRYSSLEFYIQHLIFFFRSENYD